MSADPELLGSVVVVPVNAIFWSVWRVVRAFISQRTADKFVLIRGSDWREQLRHQIGPSVTLPAHLRCADADDAQG